RSRLRQRRTDTRRRREASPRRTEGDNRRPSQSASASPARVSREAPYPTTGESAAFARKLVVVGIHSEFVRGDLLEELLELRDLGLDLLLGHFLALELDSRFLDHLVGGEDRGVGADGERDRVGRARV